MLTTRCNCPSCMLSSDEEIIAPVCGTPTWWTLQESCESTVDAFLADPTRPLELHIHNSEHPFAAQCLAQALRAKVMAQCQGSA